MRSRTSRLVGLVATIGAAALATESAIAAGFYLQEQNAAGVGRAHAGDVAVAEDASTLYYNPAGLSELPGLQAAGAIDLIIPSDKLIDRGSTEHSLGALLSNPASGGNSLPGGGSGGNPGSATPLANFYMSYHVPTTDLTVGIGASVPFGLASKYRADSFARYDSIDSFLETFDIAPTIGWKVTDWLSIGAGLDVQYAYVKLRQALPNALQLGGPSVATDGRLTLSGRTWDTGFNVGILLKPAPGTKVGFSYRYGITHNIDHGSISLTGLSGLLASANGYYSGSAALDLPDVYGVGISQRVTPDLTLLGEVDYYTWSNFKSIAVLLATPVAGTSSLVTPQNYQDTWGISVGAEYRLTDQLKLRGGVKYDETPTVDAFRDTRVPDGDRIWLAAGVHYDLTEQLSLDFSYAHLFVSDTPLNITRAIYPAPVTVTSTIKAESEPVSEVLAAGFSYRF
jgi:long-chain fatty acid transport protein